LGGDNLPFLILNQHNAGTHRYDGASAAGISDAVLLKTYLLKLDIAADTIRILVATDSHVGYNERDPIRGNDSWKSFHEVMCLAKEQDVDMVLLAGDLFHDNKPSRKSMYQVMRSLRMNCYGEKPCELEMLSDGSENFQGYVGNKHGLTGVISKF